MRVLARDGTMRSHLRLGVGMLLVGSAAGRFAANADDRGALAIVAQREEGKGARLFHSCPFHGELRLRKG